MNAITHHTMIELVHILMSCNSCIVHTGCRRTSPELVFDKVSCYRYIQLYIYIYIRLKIKPYIYNMVRVDKLNHIYIIWLESTKCTVQRATNEHAVRTVLFRK